MKFLIKPARNDSGKITCWLLFKIREDNGSVKQMETCFDFSDACRALETWSESHDPGALE